MWEQEVLLLMRALVGNRRIYRKIEDKLISYYGRLTVEQFRREALERLYKKD